MISLTSKAPAKPAAAKTSDTFAPSTRDRAYLVYVYPNIPRSLMGSNNPYIQQLKDAIQQNALAVDHTVTNKAFPDLLRKGMQADMIILNWLENLPSRRMGMLQTPIVLLYLRLLKARGKKIVWIKHNKVSHTKKWFGVSQYIHNALVRHADHIITHSQDIDLAPSPRLLYWQHPCNITPEAVLQQDNRSSNTPQPDIDLLIWGSLFPYKGILEFLQFAKNDAKLSRLNIHVVGKSTPEYWEQLQPYAGGNITLINRYIPDEEVTQLFKRTRFILFTYNKRSVMSSGILLDSLAACRKIIAPNCGAFADMAKEHSFVHLYDDFAEIASICHAHYNDFLLNYDTVCSFVARNSWYMMGQKIKELAIHDVDGND